MKRFRTLRGRLTALALLAALGAVTVLTIAFNVVLDRSLNADANARVRSLAAAAAATVGYQDGRVRVHESVDDAAVDRRVWIYDGTRAVERPPAPADLQRSADALAGRAHVFDDVPGSDLRLYAAPVSVGGRQVGTVVAAQSLEAYYRTTDLALLGSLALGAVLLAAVGVLTWITVGRALDPVREMTASAAEWGEHDLGRRFGATPRPDELGDLARTFDALLARVEASLRHEQRLSAELSHELRTPLARIIAEIELLERRERTPEDRREAYAVIERSAERMSGILETLMAAARAEAHPEAGRSEVGRVLDRVAEGWAPAVADRHVALEVHRAAAPMIAGVDAEVVERIVAPLIDNALRFARTRIVLSSCPHDGAVVVSVADDGPGVPADARDRVFEPGARAPGEVNGHGGAGLGLPLARRLAKAIGGDVTLAPAAPGAGAEFRVRLPA
jgi:signal transduction histidine kinase